ncbi:Protein SphX [Candidatus Nitrotoga arctica]|uniref:Phosphate-binding protein n=2 Tax=Candidatus Nitrotoga arctica TaxID=453162 RepID=A0ABN8AN36_9PROT|nr:Protein SphX [Candidatus Nitrotoga arctica]
MTLPCGGDPINRMERKMLKSHSLKVLGVTAALSILMSTPTTAGAVAIIKIDGSSTVYPVTEAVTEEFQKSKKDAIKVTVGISGTSGGFKKLCRGEIDIANASRPILSEEMKECNKHGIKYIELPVAYDALTVVVNPQNNWVNSMTVAELKKMWEPIAQGKMTNWNQINPAWPNAPLKLFGPDSDSGTFDFFTEVIVGKAKSSRLDYPAFDDDKLLVQGVSGDKDAIGYVGYAYYAENINKLKAVPIRSAEGKPPVLPSLETVKDSTYRPLSRPIFIYVNAKAAQKPEVKEFVEFYLKQASNLVEEVKYIPLPDAAYKLALDNFMKSKTGSGFGGKSHVDIDFSGIAEVGVSDEVLMKREGRIFP